MKESGNTENFEKLKNSAKDAPVEPGVYIWKDKDNRIIYVGKAKLLRSRLLNYFSGVKDVKTAVLMRHACSIETIIVSNEYEALLLENTLIKQHSPKYNINLKDGKTYPVIRISAENFPRIWRTRRIVEDGSLYFGPYPNIQSVDRLLSLIEKLFPLRKCKRFKMRKNPCMYFHIKRCAAPCCNKVDMNEYGIQIERVRKLLAGEKENLVSELKELMNKEAANLRFEEAAKLRNVLLAIDEMTEPHSVEDRDPEDRDYIAWAAEGVFTAFSVFSMRGGRMTGRELFCSRSAAGEKETLETFIAAYYSPDRIPPPKIFLQVNDELSASLLRFFKESFGFAPMLLKPDEKRHEASLAMARQNSLEELRRRMRERGAGPVLNELMTALSLKNRPERIEGFDIAQLEGRHPVASLVSFKNGMPDKKNYRYFKLRTVIGMVDDFASMREAVSRRYTKLLKEGIELPDLILVDGGIGQVNAAFGVLKDLGILNCDLIGLAKKEEEIWLPKAKTPVKLSVDSGALKLLQHVRDETHRFATGLNQRLRSKDLFFPVLESIDGIGPKRAAVIMETYKSLEKIAAAAVEELSQCCKISLNSARAARASAKLALLNNEKKKKELKAEFSPHKKRNYNSSAAELAAFAAEETPEYDKPLH